MSSRAQSNNRDTSDKEQGLPQAEDIEREVLAHMLVTGKAWDSLMAGHFHLERHRRIWHAIAALRDRGEPIDRLTVAEQLRTVGSLSNVGGLSYLVDLENGMFAEANLNRHIDILNDKALLRRLINQANAQINAAIAGISSADELLAGGAEFYRVEQATRNHKEEQPSVPGWPEPIAEDGYHGVAGDLVRLLEPHTEADPAGLLIQVLVAWGSLAGRGPYYLAEADLHHTNEYAVIVGTTSKGRKGTSWGRIRGVLRTVDEHWTEQRLLSGVGSGEALIDALADPDKRTLISESELARLLAVISREGCTLSAIMRDGWDTGTVSTRTRQHPVRASGVHLSMIGHVTRQELLRRLNDTELANGWANRVLWVCARRSKLLPHGGKWPELGEITRRLAAATDFARHIGNTRVEFDGGAAALWETVYADLSEGKPGLLGAVTSRAEAHCVRLALIYALLDGARKICEEHLRAALAVWRYCEDSARYIWGDALGDPAADEIRRALINGKLNRTEVRDLFTRNRPAQEIDRALAVLADMGLARSWTETSGGRPVTWWERIR
jgi:hypothetical protein